MSRDGEDDAGVDDEYGGGSRKRSRDGDDFVGPPRRRRFEEEEAQLMAGGDVDDGEDDEDDRPNPNAPKPKNNALRIVNRDDSELFELLHGDQADQKEAESRFAKWGAAEWATHSENLLRINIDPSMSNRELMTHFNLMYQLFCSPYKDEYAVVDRVRAIYPHVTTMKDQFKKLQRIFGQVHLEMMKRNLVENDTKAGREIQRMQTMIAFGMKMSFEQMVHNRLLQKCADKTMRAMLEEMSPLALFKEVDTTKLRKQQQLLHFYYMQAFKNNYRKDGDSLYRPRYNKYGEFVYAYEFVCDITDFVYESIYPFEQNQYWWECLTEKTGVGRFCVDLLTHCKCEWLPNLERNADIHSFQNGIYVLSLNQFLYFKKLPEKAWVGDLSGNNMTAIKYHDMMFDEDGMENDMKVAADQGHAYTYMSIQMVPIYKVLNTQEFSFDECQVIFALLGRMLHPLGKHDNWSVFPYFLGLAGTGKSSLLRLLASLLEVRDVGYLNNVLQKTFSIEGIADKLIYLALDIDENFGLDQATFQSMVCGEEVSVLRKFKKPMTILWKSHGGFAGNKLPPWTDNGGSLSRRLIVIEFLKPISKADPKLFEACMANRDRFLKVINSAYMEFVERFSTKSIKDCIPDKFRDSEKKALLELNVLASFIKECCDVDPDPARTNGVYIANWKDFGKAFKAFCKRNSLNAKPLNYNFYSGVFCKINIIVRTSENARTDQFGQLGMYVLGLKLKDSALEGAE